MTKDLENQKVNDLGKGSLLSQCAGFLLILAALLVIMATVAFGSLGRQHPLGWSLSLLGLLCLTGWFIGRRGTVALRADRYARQRTVLGINSLATIVLLCSVLFGLNYLAAHYHKTFDLTRTKINLLSEQTLKVLGTLPGPVSLTYIFLGRDGRPPDSVVPALLSSYAEASDKVKVQYLDAAMNPLQLQGLGVRSFTGHPLLLLQSQVKSKASVRSAERQEIAFINEASITSALMRLANPKPRILYFLNNHGELVPSSGGVLNVWGASLIAQNYTLRPLSLASPKSQVPVDAAAIVVVAPRVDLSVSEQGKLQKYLQERGRLVLFLNPPQRLARWEGLIKGWGLRVLNGFVLDHERSAAVSPQVVLGVRGEVAGDAARHPLLRGVDGDTVLPGVLPMQPIRRDVRPLFSPLFESSSRSMASTRLGTAQSAPGPFVLAAAIEAGTTRAVVVANALFATDPYITQFGNKSFALAAVNWTVGDDTLVSIPPKTTVTNTLQVPDTARRLFNFTSLFALPSVLLLMGCAVWWKRR